MKMDWRQAAVYITVMGMEGCWLYALLELLNNRAVNGQLSILGILALLPVAFIFNFLLGRLRWPRAGVWLVSWLGWVLGMLLMVKIQLFGGLPLSDPQWLMAIPHAITGVLYAFGPELLILLATAVIWWLGRRLVFRAGNFPTTVSEFQFGLIMLVFIFLIASGLKTKLDSPVPIAITFFLLALLGMSVSHALAGTGWLSGLHQGHWSGLLLATIGVVLIFGLLIAWMVTPDLLQIIWVAIKTAWGFIWSLIVKLLLFIASLFPPAEPAELPPMPVAPETGPDEVFRMWTMPEWLKSSTKLLMTIAWAGLLLAALWRISSDVFRWLRRRLAGMAGAEFEPLPGAFRADLLGFLKRVISRLLGLKLPFRLGKGQRALPPEVASVRQVYRQLLRWAAAGGYPRHLSQTPGEYSEKLAGLLPEAGGDLDLVTQRYIRARYGAFLSTGDELNELGEAWHRLKQARLRRAATRLA
ncbi:MAG TPA: DUF4129 domain-containing protein [Dehalococcoidia bacterium]|nr:DUF4129 domain-containing protein [Dehalococcoidia bacterium]